MAARETRHVYTVRPGTPRHDVEAALRGALTALRRDLEYIAISMGPGDRWPDEVEGELSRLEFDERWRSYLDDRQAGIADDLDPGNPKEFELGLLLAPFAEHLMSISFESAGEIASYSAAAEVRFALTSTQHTETVRFMKSEGADPGCLVPAHGGTQLAICDSASRVASPHAALWAASGTPLPNQGGRTY
ncbi:hypothetical protein [Terrabacter sp. BE26]|uniref:hypothetical protein n=1 Tax=Terrabacter sp. BE26 TaxID=2898152 RepID=UPI0035BE23EA